jgi:Delta7-sterol 5-desaturase
MDTTALLLDTFIKSFLSGLILNGSLITIAYILVWRIYGTKIQRWRIQLKQRADSKQIRRELINAIPTLLVGSLMSSIAYYLSTKGYTQLYSHFGDRHPVFGILGFFMLLFIDDAWFYWCHRLLHHPLIYKYVHSEHHKSVDVTPFTSMSFHFLEPFILTFWIFPVVYLVPVYAPMLALLQVWGLINNIKTHLGYEFYPKGLNKSLLWFVTSSTHHNMHHSRFVGNYGVHFRFWDKWMGTEYADYEAEYDKINNRPPLDTQP